ncbi:MAG: hypothetical protein OHK0015_51180 [Chloroflexi bacterium OHK40]
MSAPLAAEAPPEPLRWRLAVFSGYLLLGIMFTWPLATRLGDAVIQKGGLPVDAGQGVWNLWWVRSALLAGENPFVTGHLFYPAILNLFYQTLSLPNALLVWPVLAWAGPVAAFNAVTLLSFGLGGYWAYRIGRAVGGGRGSALLAGFVFAFTPYHIQRVWSGPMELIAIHWVALYALLLLRALARRTVGSVLAAAMALLVTTLASQYYGLYAAIYTGAHGTLAAALAPRGLRPHTLAAAAGVGMAWVVALLPLALLAGGLGQVALEDWYMRQVYHSVALVDLLVPNVLHPLWGPAATAWQNRVHPFGLEGGAGFGAGVSLICALALLRGWARAWPWALLAALTLLLAMGPQLRLTAAESPLPGPFLVLDLLGPFRNSSRPAIFVALMLVPLTAMVALGLSLSTPAQSQPRAPNGSRARRWQARAERAAPLALTAIVLFESLVVPWPLTPLRATPESLSQNEDSVAGAVLELPPRLNDSQGLLNQICHGRPLMGGYLARLPFYPEIAYPSAARALWEAAAPAQDIMPIDPAAELASLGVRFVALDLTQLPRGDAANLRAWLSGPGISRTAASASRELYSVDPQAARPVATLGAGWYELEAEGERRWRWMGPQAELRLLSRTRSAVRLTLRATAYGQARPLQIWRGDTLLQTVEVPAAPYDRTITLRMLLPPGATSITLVAPATPAPDGRSLSLSVEGLAVTPLPTSEAWATTATRTIPRTIPAITAAPCPSG